MQSDGPYKHYRLCDEAPCVKNSCMACAYAEGRKAAEKEFKELLALAQELCDDLGDDIAEKFRAWKKVRGIE